MNRETVIKGLEQTILWLKNGHKIGLKNDDDFWDEMLEIAENAISLLKEQEPKTGHWKGFPNNGVYDYRCSECGYVLTLGMPQSKFCPGCGVKMD